MTLLDDLVRKHYEKKRPWREVIACIRAVNLEDDADWQQAASVGA